MGAVAFIGVIILAGCVWFLNLDLGALEEEQRSTRNDITNLEDKLTRAIDGRK